jgi:dGTPase
MESRCGKSSLKSIDWPGGEFDELARHRIVRRLIGIEVNDIIRTTDQRLRESGVRSVDELQRLPYNVVSFSEDMRRRNREIKDFLYNNLYRHYRVMRMAVKAERIVTDLYQAYLNEPMILPRPFKNRRGGSISSAQPVIISRA